jgi:hypothetical protein
MMSLRYLSYRKHKSAARKHRYNVRAMDDTLIEINRDSAIFAISTPQSNSFTDDIKGENIKPLQWFVMQCTCKERAWVA